MVTLLLLWMALLYQVSGVASQSADITPSASRKTNQFFAVAGRVKDAFTCLPIDGITVTLEDPGSASTTTNAEGYFSFPSVSPGAWRAATKREHGYVSSEKFFSVDRDKNPVPHAMGSVRALGYRNGRPSLLSFHSGRTDGFGEYRIPNLLPGRYIVQAEPNALEFKVRKSFATSEEGPARGIGNVRTYYPNSPLIEGAALVTLRAGDSLEKLEKFEITLLKSETYCVTSSTIKGDGPGAPNRINVQLAELSPMSKSRVPSGSVPIGSEIEVCGCRPAPIVLGFFFGFPTERPLCLGNFRDKQTGHRAFPHSGWPRRNSCPER